MKPTVSKETQDYLKQLEEAEKAGRDLGHYQAYPDAVDQFIKDQNLRIQKLFFDTDLDLMLVVLNNRKILKESLSSYRGLSQATSSQLQSYEISPMGVHWPELDEDLSLKGFLESALFTSVGQESKVA